MHVREGNVVKEHIRYELSQLRRFIVTSFVSVKEGFSEDEDEHDEDLLAALATLRLQQEGRLNDSTAKRSGQDRVDHKTSQQGLSDAAPTDGTVITQVQGAARIHHGFGRKMRRVRPRLFRVLTHAFRTVHSSQKL